ncbi:inorganic phosphate transporter [Nonomuraea sp. NPDC001699]
MTARRGHGARDVPGRRGDHHGAGLRFTNGFHDTACAMATSIATGALRPRVAVTIAAVLNLAGAFLSVEVAKTVSGGIVDETLGDPADAVRRAGRRDLVESAHLAAGVAVQFGERGQRSPGRPPLSAPSSSPRTAGTA